MTNSFYLSGPWKAKRKEILKRDNFECQLCKEQGSYSRADTVHHIIHLEDNWELRLEDDNLVSVCSSCHNKEHPEKLHIQSINKSKIEERWD